MGGVLKYSFLPELSNGFDLSGQSQPDYHNMIVPKSKEKNSGFPNLFFDKVVADSKYTMSLRGT